MAFFSPASSLIIPNTNVPKSIPSIPNFDLSFCKISTNYTEYPLCKTLVSTSINRRQETFIYSSLSDVNSSSSSFSSSSSSSSELAEDYESPWEGAVIYRRNPSISHVEYCTTLERLGLGRLSTELSRTRASEMGLRVTKAVKDYPLGTPVQISVDVTRKRKKLRLDGIIRTVITLGCNRCGDPAADCIFSIFTLLLTEEPLEEPDVINMGVIYREDKFKSFNGSSDEEDDEDIDLDDQLYFPTEDKEIDISKPIRDMVHVEIKITALCDPKCKGFCLKCFVNLNRNSCNCYKQEAQGTDYGPLKNLKKQMQERK
eukprot:TRINITY_DN2824_c0_g6_i1.p1 TRINITY_DN2824_c0_g6~~TRINITY_DN2824_c0_g6_i1.p1  ORF type:complete len:315 (+),score=39.39 TRINITY_DN2824_c0_g6_i1:15-959(+)